MRSLFALTFLVLAGASVTACSSGSHLAQPRTTVTATVTVTPSPLSHACPAVLAAVRQTAGDMHINLGTGVASVRLTRTNLVRWLGDMLSGITAADWKPPTPATRRLKNEWYQANLALTKIHSSATLQTFVGDLQAIQNTCGA